ncbi:glycosyltransferase [Halobaculum sp. WSA2]|uniref:Glycosyltransferase n=1 Tax=Halobaculum saliterrae TaxID=2073113 RepID=A0A6B0SVE9_9EURY|nr:glycosyltransferase [Halobaculum saliterrae]
MHTLRHLVLAVLATTGTLVVGYYAVVNVFYLLIHALGLLELRDDVREASYDPPYQPFDSPSYPGVGLLVPAYNEAATIAESTRSMLALNYPDMELVVVNDGSTDDTLEVLKREYDLEPVDAEVPLAVPSEPIRAVYRSTIYEELLVVDKENGGKSDALNAALWLTEKELFCAVDSDTVIDREGLLQIVRPFLAEPSRAVASGGTIRVANECVVEGGVVEEVNLPRTGLPGLQVMEYLRAFYSGRLGMNRLNGLILISGAFGVFRTDLVRDIGGYDHDTITEDFDVVMRLHKHLSELDREYTVDFVPEPVAWTEVPASRTVLSRQRRRWYRGMLETVVTHRDMLFNPRYGPVGLLVLPMFVAAEVFGPLIEGIGYVLLPLAWYVGALNVEFFVVFFLLTTGFGVFLSWFGIFSEAWSFNRYEKPGQILRLLWYGVLENFGYRQWKTAVSWRGLVEYLRGNTEWGAMDRAGFSTGADDGDGDGGEEND